MARQRGDPRHVDLDAATGLVQKITYALTGKLYGRRPIFLVGRAACLLSSTLRISKPL